MPDVVIITGASGGIGLAACKVFVQKGFRVYGLCRKPFVFEGVDFVACDVTDRDSVFNAVSYIEKKEGRVDTLICNAGYGIAGSVEFTAVEDIDSQFEVNVVGCLNCISAMLPIMRKQNNGSIVITSSLAAIIPIPFQAFYSMSKAALNALTLALRNELRPYNIRVSALMPGDIKTGFTASRVKDFRGKSEYPLMLQSISVMEHDEQNGMDPLRIGTKLLKISQCKHPRPLYTAGAKYHAFAFLTRVLPNRLVNWIVGKLYS